MELVKQTFGIYLIYERVTYKLSVHKLDWTKLRILIWNLRANERYGHKHNHL